MNEVHLAEPMRVGSLVRWPEFSDVLFFVREMGLRFCGRDDYAKIVSIDHRRTCIVPIGALVLDDVDYVEF